MKKQWGIKEGIGFGAFLILLGIILQAILGPVAWDMMASPVNLIIIALFTIVAIMLFIVRQNVRFINNISNRGSAVAALIWAVIVTAIMGLIRQRAADFSMPPAETSFASSTGLDHCLSHWAFVLIYLWLTLILAITVINRLFHFNWRRDIGFMLNHLGILIVILTATLGNADMQRLTMTIDSNGPEWRAVDSHDQIHELPIAIELKKFTIDEYAPKLMIIDNVTGQPLPAGKPETLQLEDGFNSARLQGHNVKLLKLLDKAQPVLTNDSTYYEPWDKTGACTAALVEIDGNLHWVSCGSFMFPYKLAHLANNQSVAMPEREPKRFISDVEIMTQKGGHYNTSIMVNKPVEVEGWKIYQLNYDKSMGRWSDISIVELVKDPWLPVVYTGIYMLLAGAVMMFLTSNKQSKRKEEQQ